MAPIGNSQMHTSTLADQPQAATPTAVPTCTKVSLRRCPSMRNTSAATWSASCAGMSVAASCSEPEDGEDGEPEGAEGARRSMQSTTSCTQPVCQCVWNKNTSLLR